MAQLADPDWKEEPVEPGDQDPNGPFRKPAEDARTDDALTQAQVDAEIEREDVMDSSAAAPAPRGEDPYADPYGTARGDGAADDDATKDDAEKR